MNKLTQLWHRGMSRLVSWLTWSGFGSSRLSDQQVNGIEYSAVRWLITVKEEDTSCVPMANNLSYCWP